MNDDIKTLLIREDISVKQAMRQLEDTEKRILFVVDGDTRLVGSLVDGDIRRWILAEGNLQDPVEKVCNKRPFFVNTTYDPEQVKEVMVQSDITCVPVLNDGRQVVELIFWVNLFKDGSTSQPVKPINLPVVIMAGGKGTRLDPFTRILPKPLIPFGDKTLIEFIIESFLSHGVNRFFISVNHKSRIIKSYFEELNPGYSVEYIEEEMPLGTVGSLRYLDGKIEGPIIVTNCDVVIKADYTDLIEYHSSNKNDMTLVASLKDYNIPYGICEIRNGGVLTKITEKPEYSFLVNTGMYVVQAETLKYIPEGEVFHMTQLLEKVKVAGGKVAVYPISEDAWMDTGEWAEYRKTLEKMHMW